MHVALGTNERGRHAEEYGRKERRAEREAKCRQIDRHGLEARHVGWGEAEQRAHRGIRKCDSGHAAE